MGPTIFRLLLLGLGLAVGEIGLTSFPRGDPVWVIQIAVSIVLLVAGSAGFIQPLLRGTQGGQPR